MAAWQATASKLSFRNRQEQNFAIGKGGILRFLVDFVVFRRSFLNFFAFFADLGLTRCGGAIKKEEIFDSYIYKTGDSYEAKTIFLSGRGLPLRGGGGGGVQRPSAVDP